MSAPCPYEETTLLWLYGEADDATDHAAHVAGCAACTALADDQVDVLGVVAPVARALVPRDAALDADPANRPAWPIATLSTLATLAAAALLWMSLPGPPAPSVAVTDTDVFAAAAPALPRVDDLDLRLDALDDELATLALDFETL